MFNYEKTKEMLDLAKKLGPEYGAISDNASMHKQEMFNDHSPRRSGRYPWKTDGYLHLEDQVIRNLKTISNVICLVECH